MQIKVTPSKDIDKKKIIGAMEKNQDIAKDLMSGNISVFKIQSNEELNLKKLTNENNISAVISNSKNANEENIYRVVIHQDEEKKFLRMINDLNKEEKQNASL